MTSSLRSSSGVRREALGKGEDFLPLASRLSPLACVHTLILMLSPLSHLTIHSFSCDGVKPVRTGSHGPRAPMPPSSAFDKRTRVDFGVVLTAWLSGSNPNLSACTCFFLHGSESNWCMGISHDRVMDCCAPYLKLL